MDPLVWKTGRYISVGPYQVPFSDGLRDDGVWHPGVRRELPRTLFLKSLLWPIVKLRNDLLVDGFIEWVVGRWIRSLIKDDTTFLEIGCGDMSLSRYVPQHLCYNAFDVSLSELHLRRLLRRRSNANVAIASVTDIPLQSNEVSLIVCTQVLEYISEVDRAIDEIRRVATPRAKFACSIANGWSYKYRAKGVHRGHVNRWTYFGFLDLMTKHGFTLLAGEMRGIWIPIPGRLSPTSYALPINARHETYNTNFIFLFEVDK